MNDGWFLSIYYKTLEIIIPVTESKLCSYKETHTHTLGLVPVLWPLTSTSDVIPLALRQIDPLEKWIQEASLGLCVCVHVCVFTSNVYMLGVVCSVFVLVLALCVAPRVWPVSTRTCCCLLITLWDSKWNYQSSVSDNDSWRTGSLSHSHACTKGSSITMNCS